MNVDQLSSAEGHAAQKEAGIGAAAESAAEPIGAVSLHRLPKSTALLRAKQKYARTLCAVVRRSISPKELVISENTVWSHVKNVYAKTGAAGKNALIELFEKSALGE